MIDFAPVLRQLDRDGYALFPGVIPDDECQTWRVRLAELAETSHEFGVRQRRNRLYAVRNLIDVCPELPQLWQRAELLSLLTSLLGTGFGLVRGMLFDKPPDLTWAVPWHQDRTIVIEHPTDLSPLYSPPRLKASAWHCEAPAEVLASMLALRIHLDDVTDSNGPLEVAPGTHRTGKSFDPPPTAVQRIHARSGDVLAMRPLLAHASPKSLPNAAVHRRVVHLEFAAHRELPDGYQWRDFVTAEMPS